MEVIISKEEQDEIFEFVGSLQKRISKRDSEIISRSFWQKLFGTGIPPEIDFKRYEERLRLACQGCQKPLNLTNFTCGNCDKLNVSMPGQYLTTPLHGCNQESCENPKLGGYRCNNCKCLHVFDHTKIRQKSKLGLDGNGIATVHPHVSGEDVFKGFVGLAGLAAEILHPDGIKGAVNDLGSEIQKERQDNVDFAKAQSQKRRDQKWKDAELNRPSHGQNDDEAEWIKKHSKTKGLVSKASHV